MTTPKLRFLKSLFVGVMLFMLPAFPLLAQVANDDCGTAQPITIPSSGTICINGTTTGAVSDGSTNACDTGPAGNEVWFTFVATGPINDVTVTPQGANPISDIVVTTYTGGCAAPFIEGCENGVGATPVTDNTGVVAGTQMWVSVESNGNDGDFELCIQSSDPPGNPGNTCAQAAPLCRKEPFSYGQLNGFTASGFRPTCFASAVQRDIWFKFTVGQTGTLEWAAFPLVAQEYDWALYDITNGCPNNGTAPVACNYNFSQPAVGAEANPIGMGPPQGGGDPGEFSPAATITAGRTYALVIDNYSGNNGGFDFKWGGTFKMAPYSEFELNPYQACNELTTSFTNNSYGADSYSWSFGDGTSSNAANPPSKTYSDPGNYIVSLTTTTDQGCTHTVTRVAVVSAPIVTLESDKDTICLGDAVELTGSATMTSFQNPIPFTKVEDTNVPDNNPAGYTSTISVFGVYPNIINPGFGEVMSVNLSIDHKRASDLDIKLTCPNGTSIILTSDNGGNGDNYENTTFEAGAPPITGGAAPFNGTFSPEEPFTNLNGCPVSGDWKLNVVDDQNGDEPYFDEWSISFKNENSLTYSWEPAAEIPNQTDFTHTVSPTVNTTYTLEAEDALGCIETVNKEIIVEIPPEAGLDTTLSICQSEGSLNLAGLIRNATASDGDFLDPFGTLISSNIDLNSAPSGTYQYRLIGTHCPEDLANFNIQIDPNPTAQILKDTTVCPDEEVPFTLDIQGGIAPYTVNMNWDNNDTTFTTSDNTSTYSITVDQQKNFVLNSVLATGDPGCPAILDGTTSITLDVFDSPTATVSNMICSGDNSTYQIEITITGGDQNNLTVNGVAATSPFLSSPIPNGGNYSFLISDINDCEPTLLEGKEFCACLSDAGTVDLNQLDICEGDLATALPNNDETAETDDVIRFVLHDSPTQSIGVIYAWNTTPTFGFIPGLNYETTYYISRIIGDPEPGNSAEVDLDECYSLSEGTPVVFHEIPDGLVTVRDNPICKGDTFFFDFISTAGIPRYDLTFDLNGTVYNENNLNPLDDFFIVPDSAIVLTWIEIENDFCGKAKNDILNLNLMAAPEAYMSGNYTYCENDGNSPVYLHIDTDGDGTLFNIQYTDGNSVQSVNNLADGDSIPVSPPAGMTTNYTIVSVTDNSGSTCPGIVGGMATVNVGLEPQANIAGDFEFCEFDSEEVLVGISNGSGSYTIEWSDQLGNNFIEPNGTDTNSFSISPTAGNYTYQLDRVTDNLSSCEAVLSGQATAVVVAAPSARISTIDTLCEQPVMPIQTDVQFDLITGTAPFTIYYSDSISGYITSTNSQADFLENVTPFFNAGVRTTTRYVIDSIVDGSAAGCVGMGTGSASITINPTPTANLSGSSLICLGDSAPLQVFFTGSDLVTAEILGTDGSSKWVQGNNNNTVTIYFQPNTNTSYSVGTVYDANNPSCSGNGNGTGQIDVNNIPVGAVDIVPDEICLNDGALVDLQITADNDVTAYLSDSYGNNYIENVTVPNGYQQFNIPGTNITNPAPFTITLDSLIEISSAACTSRNLGNDNLIVNPLPTLALSTSKPLICFGDPSDLIFIAGPDNGPFEVSYTTENGQQVETFPMGQTTRIINPNGNFQYSATLIENLTTGCSSTLSETVDITVKENPVLSVKADTSICLGQELNLQLTLDGTPDFDITFDDNLGNNYTYTVGTKDLNLQFNFNTVGTYNFSNFNVIEKDFPNCRFYLDTTTTTFINGAPPVDFNVDFQDGCSPRSVVFTNTTDPQWIDRVFWEFGNGETSTQEVNTSMSYVTPGFYNVRLTVVSSDGCIGSLTRNDYIQVYPNPVADFISSPNPATVRAPKVNFENTSSTFIAALWRFDTLGASSFIHPEFIFPSEDDRTYEVELQVENEYGCRDTIIKNLRIHGVLSVNIPNTFTPDGDGINDVFIPVIEGMDEQYDKYRFVIFDRWGQIVFETNDPKEGWDGRLKKGTPAKLDVYAYRVEVLSKYDAKKHLFNGHIQVLK